MFGRYQEAGRQIRNAETAGTNGQQVLLDAGFSAVEELGSWGATHTLKAVRR